MVAVWLNREFIPSPTVIEKMLRFIYSGVVWNLKEAAANLLVAGEESLVADLKKLCEEVLV